MLSLRRALLLCCILLPLPAAAQYGSEAIHLTKDSLYHNLNGPHWRFTPTDLPDGAATALDDSRWPVIRPGLYVNDNNSPAPQGFQGIGWMRLHIIADTSMAGLPLGLAMSHYGASQIYLDGALLDEFGKPGPKDSAKYYDPQEVPVIITLPAAGHHVLAVRYANWEWRHNRRLIVNMAGFSASLYDADNAIYGAHRTAVMLMGFTMTLFGIFLALALAHLILFLYYRAERSNALFSCFAFCMCLLFLLMAVIKMNHSPEIITGALVLLLLSIVATCCSLSALITQLLSKRRWPLYAICALGLLSLVFGLNMKWGMLVIITLIIVSPLQVVVTTVSAMWRRVPGARILGAGVLLFTALLLFAIISNLVNGGFDVNDSTTSGKIIEIFFMIAILAIPISMSAYLSWRFATVNRSLSIQLGEVERLSAEAMRHEAEKQHMLESRQEELEREVAARTEDLLAQKKKSDDLLLNILPAEIAEELKETGRSEARLYNEVSVLFTDFVDFTQTAENMSPAALVAEIDECFKAFDDITGRHGLEKIKTVGDAYIAVSGMPAANADHAQSVVGAALEIAAFMKARKAQHPYSFGIRLGVHSGPVVAGIVGVKKFAYDIWGDTVNTAARMEQHSEAGLINISETTYQLVKDAFPCAYRGELEAKHKGKMGMYFVES